MLPTVMTNHGLVSKKYKGVLDYTDTSILWVFGMLHKSHSLFYREIIDGETYYYLPHERILYELPLLTFGHKQLSRRLKKYIELRLLDKKVLYSNENGKIRKRNYYKTGQDFHYLIHEDNTPVDNSVETSVKNSFPVGTKMSDSVGTKMSDSVGTKMSDICNIRSNIKNNISSANNENSTDDHIVEKSGQPDDIDKNKKVKERRDPGRLQYYAKKVIDEINEKGGRHFDYSKTSMAPILARLREGHPFKLLMAIVQNKAKDKYFKEGGYKYLRPTTLFNTANFGNYKEAVVKQMGGAVPYSRWAEDKSDNNITPSNGDRRYDKLGDTGIEIRNGNPYEYIVKMNGNRLDRAYTPIKTEGRLEEL